MAPTLSAEHAPPTTGWGSSSRTTVWPVPARTAGWGRAPAPPPTQPGWGAQQQRGKAKARSTALHEAMEGLVGSVGDASLIQVMTGGVDGAASWARKPVPAGVGGSAQELRYTIRPYPYVYDLQDGGACLVCGTVVYGQAVQDTTLDGTVGVVHATPCGRRMVAIGAAGFAKPGAGRPPLVSVTKLVTFCPPFTECRQREQPTGRSDTAVVMLCQGPGQQRVAAHMHDECIKRVQAVDIVDEAGSPGNAAGPGPPAPPGAAGEKRGPAGEAGAGAAGKRPKLAERAGDSPGPAKADRPGTSGSQHGVAAAGHAAAGSVVTDFLAQSPKSKGSGPARGAAGSPAAASPGSAGRPVREQRPTRAEGAAAKEKIRVDNAVVQVNRQATKKVSAREQTGGQQLLFAIDCIRGCCQFKDDPSEPVLCCRFCEAEIHAACVGVCGARRALMVEEGWTCLTCGMEAAGVEQMDMTPAGRIKFEKAELQLMTQQLAELRMRRADGTVSKRLTVINHMASFVAEQGMAEGPLTPSRLAMFGAYLASLPTIGSAKTVRQYMKGACKAAIRKGETQGLDQKQLMESREVEAGMRLVQSCANNGAEGGTPLNRAFAVEILRAILAQPSDFCASRGGIAFCNGRYSGGRAMDQVTKGDACGWMANGTKLCDGKIGGIAYCTILLQGGKIGEDEQTMVMPYLTKGTHIAIGDLILEHTRRWGIKTVFDEETGVTSFDSCYLRINLAGLGDRQDDLAAMEAAVGACPAVARCVAPQDRKEFIQSMKARAKSTKGVERWAPVAIGTKAEMEEVIGWWKEKVFPSTGRNMEMSVVDAPMLRTTFGRGARAGVMPWSYAAMQDEFSTTFSTVYMDLKERKEFDKLPLVGPGQKVKLGTHCMRIGADAEAVELQAVSGATDTDINMVFRWKLNQIKEEMKERYRGFIGLKLLLRVLEYM